ncbi:malonyl-ACP O-methyltransferase BioC [Desulfobulbus sp. US1]|nr:malonyl-ACP O-methyltransferase BioC [Desulfobulbus sp. US4]MCW5204482.1 malonyl-ACP O-methyltransferase BioC [Desulfobulbus sp. N2]MCW5208072.1 malonyl-ACP O-methyltransferase BioC [Desulfobulbus sp. US2]MCW5209469.1 malonyl-ACP O-methyltransferase BioC [Desulfobulbus sp. US1]MCW5210845.1 malonyl-ACP O-methyltransferase BioC [Desulfobulbus sp. N3]
MQKIDKHLVCRQFRRAAASYDRQATIQHRVADRLLAVTAQYTKEQQALSVLEIGCCTGLLTSKLLNSNIKVRSLILNDLMPDFAERLPQNLTVDKLSFLPGDIEKLPLPGPFDLIISSSTFHWLDDLEQSLDKLLAALAPGGVLAFSLYGPDNLPEIKELTGVGLNYLSLPEIRSMLKKRCLLEESYQDKEIFLFPKPRDVLNHLRQTGVNSINRKPWTRQELHSFCREYTTRFQVDQAVRLTYNPLYFVARRSRDLTKKVEERRTSK